MSDFEDRSIIRAVSDQEASLSEEAFGWFTRLRSEQCSAEERQAFEAWRRRSPAHALAFDEACALWDDPALQGAASEAARVSGQGAWPETTHARAPRRRWRIALAASVAGLLIAAGAQLEIPLRLASDYRTPTGTRQIVHLPDHSTVTLNAQSAIAVTFDGAVRRVNLLKGEALFQVAPDKAKAFVVESRETTTRAVGTAFLVREEPDGSRVVVTEGVVELAPVRPGWAPIQLAAGQQAALGPHGPGLVRDVDLKQATAWVRGRLVADNERLADVVAELRRYYPGTIHVWSRAAGEIRVSGSYSLDDPAGVLASLVRTLPVRMVRVTDRAVILF